MKTPSTPAAKNPKQQLSQMKPTSDFQLPDRKVRSFGGHLKVAAKKAFGVFAIFLFRRKRNVSEESVAELGRNNGQVRAVSFSRDASSGSNGRSSSKPISSFSVSSSSTAASGQVGSSNFSFEEILKATENFSPANVIGEGAFGTVYKGKLKDGSLVAVKRARKNMYNQHPDFKNEVLTLSQIEHLNLVRLYGFLEHADERVMVVEYVSNGTLREHLDGLRGNGLEIAERLDIAIDVAHAVTYLHTYTDPPIIHRDIKASNILITEKLRAKVADFGFARSVTEGSDATHISTQVKGSMGYLDPEYLTTYQLSEKSDVYSFGVLLVEMMTGRHPIDSKRPLREKFTTKWALQKLKDKESVLAMDWRIRRNPASVKAHEEVLKLAQGCLARTKHSRPSMRKCVETLWRIRREYKESGSTPPAPVSHNSADFPNRNVKDHRHTSFGIKEGESFKFVSA